MERRRKAVKFHHLHSLVLYTANKQQFDRFQHNSKNQPAILPPQKYSCHHAEQSDTAIPSDKYQKVRLFLYKSLSLMHTV